MSASNIKNLSEIGFKEKESAARALIFMAYSAARYGPPDYLSTSCAWVPVNTMLGKSVITDWRMAKFSIGACSLKNLNVSDLI